MLQVLQERKLDLSNNKDSVEVELALSFIRNNVLANRLLKHLVLSGTNIDKLELAGFYGLEVLSAEACKMQQFSIKNCPNIREIKLSKNRLVMLQLQAQPEVLDLFSNHLQSVFLGRQPKLKNINLRSNMLKFLDLSGLPVLETVDIRYNDRLQTVLLDIAGNCSVQYVSANFAPETAIFFAKRRQQEPGKFIDAILGPAALGNILALSDESVRVYMAKSLIAYQRNQVQDHLLLCAKFSICLHKWQKCLPQDVILQIVAFYFAELVKAHFVKIFDYIGQEDDPEIQQTRQKTLRNYLEKELPQRVKNLSDNAIVTLKQNQALQQLLAKPNGSKLAWLWDRTRLEQAKSAQPQSGIKHKLG
jgi:hypothetical protein